MTTAKKSGSKKTGKASARHQSPPSPAASERKRKGRTRGKEASPDARLPKLSKTEVGGGEGSSGGQLH
ncbi:MAG TPA: hypothetical protein VIW80_02770 [Pyrinomonadaceae bacterium]